MKPSKCYGHGKNFSYNYFLWSMILCSTCMYNNTNKLCWQLLLYMSYDKNNFHMFDTIMDNDIDLPTHIAVLLTSK